MLHRSTNANLVGTHAAAVVIPTVLRPALERALQSVFRQRIEGTLQILIGIDVIEGEPAVLDRLAHECPAHIRIDVLEPGYSTAFKRGGLYPCRAGGALRSILSYLANSVYVAYLDDDNWWAPTHLSGLLTAIQGADWAFSHRWFVEAETEEAICVDCWESLGPDAGVYGPTLGGFVDTSSLMLNKLACHDVLPAWSRAAFPDGSGEDRLVFDALKTRDGRCSGQATSYYLAKPDDAMAANRLQYFRENGIVLPSQKRAHVTSLEVAIAPFAERLVTSTSAADDRRQDALLSALVERLRPQEILSFAANQSDVALDLAVACETAGLHPVIAVFEPPAGLASFPGSQWAVVRSASIECLDKAALAVDLVHVAALPVSRLREILPRLWRIVRAGGIVLGDGEAAEGLPLTVFLNDFAYSYRAELLPASVDGRHRWMLQKA